MLEDGRCSLCEIPEHHSTSTAIPLPPPVQATPSTTRRHARHHVHQTGERKHHTQHSDIGEIRLHSNHKRLSGSPEAAPINDHKPHTLSQFTNLIYTPRHAINEEPIYSSRSRHAVNEEPTFMQELSTYMKKNHHSYDGGSSRNLNNNDLNYTQNPNFLSDDIYGYPNDPGYKINNLPHSRSRSNSYNNQILNPKSLYTPNSRLHESSKSNTLPTNILPGRHGSHVSSLQGVDQDYFLNMSRSRFSLDGMKKRETKKQRITVQSVMLIGCFSLLFVVGIIMFVAVCYQNGWLGLGEEEPQEDNLPRRRNDVNRRYDPIRNFPNNVHRQRGAGLGGIHNEYPRIGLSGGRRQPPSNYEDRVYQQSRQFSRRTGHQAVDNYHVNNPIDELSTAYQQLPRFERLIDDQIGDNRHINSPIDELLQTASFVDNHPLSTIPSNLLHDSSLVKENFQTSSTNMESVTNDDQWNLAFTGDENYNSDGMQQNLNTERLFLQERVVINVPHHSIELSHNENLENIPASKAGDKVSNIHVLETDEETASIDQSNKSLMNKSDISHDNQSTSSGFMGSKHDPLQNNENSSTLSSLEGSKTVPLKALSHLLKAEPSRSKILSVVAGVLISSDPT